jgi:hypothetical protein
MEAIFYAEFDIKEGSKIVAQVPREELTPTAFDSISDFVIPHTALCESVITVLALGGKRVTSFPLRIEDERYQRNSFSFTFGMVFDSHTPPGVYCAVLRKLAYVMQALELESSFLSGPDTKVHSFVCVRVIVCVASSFSGVVAMLSVPHMGVTCPVFNFGWRSFCSRRSPLCEETRRA